MKINLPYGHTSIPVELPDDSEVLQGIFQPGLTDEAAGIQAALRQPIGSSPLKSLVKNGQKVVIVHTDITRATPNARILPVILQELEEVGVHRNDIILLNALGTHRKQNGG